MGKKPTILVIEDDSDIQALLSHNLRREGYRVYGATDGETGLELAAAKIPDLILLDLMLPGVDGLEVCRLLKQKEDTRSIPLVMLTAKGEEADIVLGLRLGADDYITKPFSIKELLARLGAVLRRTPKTKETGSGERIQIGPMTIDSGRYEVRVEDELVPMTRAEFRLLRTLASHPGRVYTRDQLIDRITGGESIISERNVDVHVRAIRKKLGCAEDLVVTVRGVGYKCRD